MSMLHTNPASIAAALERAAADLRAMGDIEHAGFILQINLQAAMHGGDESARIAAVDLLAKALTGATGCERNPKGTLYGLHYDATYAREDTDMAVYCGLDERPDDPQRSAS